MKIKIIAISKTNEAFVQEGIDKYTKMLKKYADVEFQFIKETPVKDDVDYVIINEGAKILDAIPGDYYKIALDPNGKEFTSLDFSSAIENIRDYEGGKVVFIIGGPLGLSSEVLDIVDLQLSLSKMTFPHQLIRLFLLEQVYRAFSILFDTPYHK